MQPLPEPASIWSLVGRADLELDVVSRLLGHATTAARGLTGGVGFADDGATVDPVIAAILVRGVTRALQNPEIPVAAVQDPFSGHPGSFADWSDADLVLLETFRRHQP